MNPALQSQARSGDREGNSGPLGTYPTVLESRSRVHTSMSGHKHMCCVGTFMYHACKHDIMYMSGLMCGHVSDIHVNMSVTQVH